MSKKTFDAAKDSQIPRRRSIYGGSRLSNSIKKDKTKASDVAASVTESTTASNDKTSSPGKSLQIAPLGAQLINENPRCSKPVTTGKLCVCSPTTLIKIPHKG